MKAAFFKSCVFSLLLLYAGALFGGVEPAHSAYLPGKLFVPTSPTYLQNATFTNDLGNFSAPTPPYIFSKKQQVRKIENMLELYLNPDFITFIDFSYAVEVEVELTKYELNASAPKTEIITLKINYHPDERTQWIEKANYHFTNCGRVDYKVLNIILYSDPKNQVLLTTPQKQLVATVIGMRSDIVIERYFPFDPSTPPSNNLQAPSFDAAKNELTISWLPIPGAEFYDLEWAYVDDYDKSLNNQVIKIPPGQLTSPQHFNLDRNSTRVQITQNSYTFPLVFESGYILYRIRGTGMDYEPLTDKVYPMTGSWSTTHAPGATVLTWPHKFSIPTPFENDKINWQVVTSYAEEGKSKSVISFMDGTFRNRQTITGLSTEKEAMVAEQIYDHQGRPAIQVLPVPTGDPALKFYKHFNLKAPGQAYSRNDFDVTKLACQISADPMHTASGASQYYSPNNPVKFGMHAYLPDASGFPFIQTEYTPDNTGRIRRQSGVGPDHRLGSGHETVYYYGTPVQEELSMLFGVEAGHANHYKKNVVEDPNGQLSVSFLDLKGKVVATALAGNPPVNLDKLDSYQPYQMDIDLLVFNTKDSLSNELEASRSFTVTTDSYYNFSYTLSNTAFEAALCDGIKLCYDCVYDLEVTVIDNYSCNTVLYHEVTQINPLQKLKYDGSLVVDGACPKGPTAFKLDSLSSPNAFKVWLTVGSYTVIKKLKVNPAATDAYVKHYLTKFEQKCKSVYDSILQSYMSKVDSLACELDDEEPPLNRCQIARQGMLGDVSPNGQYGHVDWASNSSTDPLSVFNQSNRLPETQANWKNGSLVYKDENGMSVQFRNAAGQWVAHTDQSIDLATFLQQWQPSFANALLRFHPEYCYLQWCESDMPSFDFDVQVATVNKYSDAVSKGYLSAGGHVKATISNQDPYFKSGGGGSGQKTWIDDRIKQYYPPFIPPPPAGAPKYSMLEIATWTALINEANPNLSASNPNPSVIPPFSDVGSWLTNPGSKSTQFADTVWTHFRALYLSKKEERQYIDRTDYAILKCSNKGGYNGCIGEDNFNWLGGAGNLAFGGPFNSNTTASACHWKTYHLYSKKAKRFPSVYDVPVDFDPYGDPDLVIGQFADWAEGMKGEYCDTCVCNKALTQFVNWVIDTKPYLGSSNQHILLPNTPFTAELKQAFATCNISSLSHFKASLQTNVNILDIQFTNGTSSVGWVSLEIPAGSAVNWRNADSLSCIKYIGHDGAFHFGAGNLYSNSKKVQPIKIGMSPDCIVDKCSDPGLACPPTEEAKYLAQLFNSLISQKKLDKALTLDNNYISPGFAAYFSPISGAMPPIFWSGQLSGNTLQATLIGGSLNCRFTLEIPTSISNLGPVISFKPDATKTDPATGYTYHAVLKVAMLTGTSTVDIKVKSECFPFSYCGKCPPSGQKTPTHDPTKPCYPCDALDYTLDYDSLTVSSGPILARELSIMVHQKPPKDLCDPCSWPDSVLTVPFPNPCLEEQILAAYANAANVYQQYLDSLTAAIRNGYIRHCMTAAETFSASYTDDLHHFTLYYYDQAGNLVKTVPPDGVKRLSVADTKKAIKYMQGKTSTPVNPAHTMASDYTFNSLNQVRNQTIPDHDGPSEFFYDYLSRIVVSQNPEQAKTNHNRYSYTLYDPLNRPIETGEILNAATKMSAALAKDEKKLLAWIAAQTKREVTRTQYDKPLPGIANQFFNGDESNYRDRIASVTYAEMDGSAVKNSTYYRYDIHGNVSHLVQDVFGLSPKKMEYDYDLISGNVKQVWYQKGEVDQYLHRYQYDADNRIITVRTSRNGKVWDVDADYFYYRHGPLARTELGEYRVQGLDYAYTLHGWIKGVNSATLDENTDIGRDGRKYPQNLNIKIGTLTAKDAFGYTLRYYTGDYRAIAPPTVGWEPAYAGTLFHRSNRDLFNGNIQSMITAIDNPANAGTNFKPLGYAYNYDQLNRITSMQAYDGLNTKFNNWNSLVSAPYAATYSYDGNGNLQTLTRKGTTAGGSPLDMDDFKYQYYPGRNRLEYVDDAIAAGNYPDDIDDQSQGNYRYDAIGNLVRDISENLTIDWNVAGKVRAIQKPASAELIQFHYDPTGKRVIKRRTNTSTQSTEYTYYVLNATGNVMATYTDTETPPLKNKDVRLQAFYLYGSSRLGEERIDTSLTDLKNMQNRQNGTWYSYRSRGAKYFELSNHLGNVLATVSDRKLPYDPGKDGRTDGYTADIWTAQDYYPFGSGMPGREFSEGGYRYGYQNQEMDNETYGTGNTYAYKYRMHDSRLIRFWSVDPLYKKYPYWSPYAFSGNRVIDKIEFEGLEPSDLEAAQMTNDVYNTENGKYKEGFSSTVTGGWELNNTLDVSKLKLTDKETGFNSAIYQKKKKDGSYEYVYVTQGTNPESPVDWETDVDNAKGKWTLQYMQSISNALMLHMELRGQNLFFAGHSLGGGLASANALVTGHDAWTFNAAALGKTIRDEINSKYRLNSLAKIKAYVIEGELVEWSQSKMGLRAEGEIIKLPATYFPENGSSRADEIIRLYQRGINHTMGKVLEKMTSLGIK